ncbi:MAG: RsmB/NOP family class I SAM-dependent RNA methyltransferase [Pseudomonadota bacterium]
MADPLAARRAVLQALHAVLHKRRPLDEALTGDLDSRDRAFAYLLVTTVLRRLGQIDAVIDGMVERRLPRSAMAVRDILRLGIGQLLFLETPAHAAVDTAVSLVADRGLDRFTGLVNAVLRRAARDRETLLDGQDAARLNTPDWLWESWVTAYGEARARAVAETHMLEPTLDLTVKGDAKLWAQRLEASLLPTGTLRLPVGGSVIDLPGFDAGAWWVQDAGAALAAPLLGNVEGARVLDLCAAPGGKTAQLAAAGAVVTAIDRSARRLDRVRENLARLRLEADCEVADGSVCEAETPYDAVLLDAPCSSTGTIRRHPDVARSKTQDDVAKLAALQQRLLDNAVTLVRPGGLIVYSTCSLQPEEGERQIARLIGDGAPVERVPIDPAEVGGLGEIINDLGEVRSLPCHAADWGGLDGFHIARLRRTGA